MDADRLPAVLRCIGVSRSRRSAVAALLSTPLALHGLATSDAKHKKKGCKGKPDNSACKKGGRCLAGVCNPKPTCAPVGTPCPATCCSQACVNPDGQLICNFATTGQPCLVNADCFGGRVCLGYVCS